MIFKSMDDAGIATVLMTREEAHVFHRALTIAKLDAGDDVVLGHVGRKDGINIEHLRNVTDTISKN